MKERVSINILQDSEDGEGDIILFPLMYGRYITVHAGAKRMKILFLHTDYITAVLHF
jgi:hypothetical protein